jgi:hypothetical protein
VLHQPMQSDTPAQLLAAATRAAPRWDNHWQLWANHS